MRDKGYHASKIKTLAYYETNYIIYSMYVYFSMFIIAPLYILYHVFKQWKTFDKRYKYNFVPFPFV